MPLGKFPLSRAPFGVGAMDLLSLRPFNNGHVTYIYFAAAADLGPNAYLFLCPRHVCCALHREYTRVCLFRERASQRATAWITRSSTNALLFPSSLGGCLHQLHETDAEWYYRNSGSGWQTNNVQFAFAKVNSLVDESMQFQNYSANKEFRINIASLQFMQY